MTKASEGRRFQRGPDCLDGSQLDCGQPVDVSSFSAAESGRPRRSRRKSFHSLNSISWRSASIIRVLRHQEVEQGILRPIEGAIRGVDGIREISSEAREGRGEVLIELVAGQQRMKAFQDIEQAVSRIRTFPDQIEQPEVRLQSEQREAVQVAIYGPINVWELRKLAEQLRDQLQANEQITQVELRRVPAVCHARGDPASATA